MKVLVIPDCHLKGWLYKNAVDLMEKGIADLAVSLMDIPDDWGKQYELDVYEETFNTAIAFAKSYPETKWCYGNHDLSYLWSCLESGYSSFAASTVKRKLYELQEAVPDDNLQYLHQIDSTIFSHAGLTAQFVRRYIQNEEYDNTEQVVNRINRLGIELWVDDSPIWVRPQYNNVELYKQERILQAVGHTPVQKAVRVGNLLSVDTCSTYRNRNPIGNMELTVVNTKTWEYFVVKE